MYFTAVRVEVHRLNTYNAVLVYKHCMFLLRGICSGKILCIVIFNWSDLHFYFHHRPKVILPCEPYYILPFKHLVFLGREDTIEVCASTATIPKCALEIKCINIYKLCYVRLLIR